MLRWLSLFLLILNLGVLFWGWSRDRPLEPPLAPMAQAPREVRLAPQEQAPIPSVKIVPDNPETNLFSNPEQASGVGTQNIEPAEAGAAGEGGQRPSPDPVSVYEGGGGRQLSRVALPETLRERVDPGLLPDELDAEPPTVIPPVREVDPGVTHTWSRD